MLFFKSLFLGATVLLLVITIPVEAQLLRPRYSLCPKIDYPTEKVIVKLLVGDKDPAPVTVKIENDFNYTLINPAQNVLPKWCSADEIVENEIILRPASADKEEESRADIYILASINSDCEDTVQHIELIYSPRLFEKFLFLTRLEAGYILGDLNHSVNSIFSNENYTLDYYNGFLVGLDIIEVSAPDVLSGFKLNFGAVYRNTQQAGTIGNDISGVNSIYDISARFGAELPLKVVGKPFESFSANLFLTLPWMSFSNINSEDTQPGLLNDELTLNISYGLGLRYYLNDVFCVGARFIVNKFQSKNSSMDSGSKISYDLFRSELTFAIVDFYNNLYNLFKY